MTATLRIVGVILAALLLGAQVVRSAWVLAFVEDDPDRAARLWPSHPDVEAARSMVEIARATRAGQPIAPATFARISDAAARAPLSSQPFLVRGVLMQVRGSPDSARAAFAEAERRDARSVAARYFLADQYLRSGQPGPALSELAVLAKLIPGGLNQLAPFLATYAANGQGARQLQRIFTSDPMLANAVLGTLATMPGRAGLAIGLGRTPSGYVPGGWRDAAIKALLDAGRFGQARALWAGFNGIPANVPSLFNPRFTDNRGGPPFNWKLTSDATGLAEPDGKGGLHLLYYGRDDVNLATQTLVLAPGNYLLSARVSGNEGHAEQISWTIGCLPGGASLLQRSLVVTERASGGAFTVPAAGCGAQQLSLTGTAPDVPQTVDVTLGALTIAPVGRP